MRNPFFALAALFLTVSCGAQNAPEIRRFSASYAQTHADSSASSLLDYNRISGSVDITTTQIQYSDGNRTTLTSSVQCSTEKKKMIDHLLNSIDINSISSLYNDGSSVIQGDESPIIFNFSTDSSVKQVKVNTFDLSKIPVPLAALCDVCFEKNFL